MNFQETAGRDLYRWMAWGPYRSLCRWAPCGAEVRLHRALGGLAHRFSRGHRERVHENLRRGLPDRDDLEDVVAQTFASHFAEQYLCFSLGRIGPSNWNRYLRFKGLEHLETSLAQEKGVVLMHPHMGPAQLPLCVLGVLGHEVMQIMGVPDVSGLSAKGRSSSELRASLEKEMPVQLQDGASFLRPAIRMLEQGGIVFSAMDGTGGGTERGRRISRQVLGAQMPVPVAAVWLALQSGGALHLLSTRFEPDGTCDHVAEIGPALSLERSGTVEEGLEAGADLVAELLTGLLRAHPGDWLFWDEFEPGGLLSEGN